MADPINYCSWVANSFCITQSEWATWTQAALTVLTFAIALVRQHRTDKRAALQKQMSDEALLQERREHAEQQRIANEALLAETRFNRRLRAKAIAISLKPDLNKFCSLITVVELHGLPDTPAQALADYEEILQIRHRAQEAVELGDIGDRVLSVVDAAQNIHNYLSAIRANSAFSPQNSRYINETIKDAKPRAEEAVQVLLGMIWTESSRE